VLTVVTSFIADSLPSLSLRSGTVPVANGAARVRTRSHWRARPHLIHEDLFRDVLVRERKRADRFEQPLLLVTVTPASEGSTDGSTGTWGAAVDALVAAKRDTDIVGWLESGSVLDVGPDHAESMNDIGVRVASELAARTARDASASFSVAVHAYNHGAADADSLPDVSQVQRRAVMRDGLKRSLDVLGSAALLVLLAPLAPLFLLIAAIVKLTSPGPVFFRQQRIGEAARPFTMLKFRTMRADADSSLHQAYVSQFISAGAAAAGAQQDAPFKIANDPRVTRVGSLLRKTSFDELPQLWNVLLGDMSLVGPRPPLAYEVERYKPWHLRRVLEARPGITGLWQVRGRSRTTFDDMVRLDLRYARTCSAWTDIKILLATPKAVISGKGAC
jgi:lipopolysaccharide/colanic/teichoic acid biosynthesis glycosyltransferase